MRGFDHSPVGREVPGRPLTDAQKRVLVALSWLCPDLGSETTLQDVATVAQLRPGAAPAAREVANTPEGKIAAGLAAYMT